MVLQREAMPLLGALDHNKTCHDRYSTMPASSPEEFALKIHTFVLALALAAVAVAQESPPSNTAVVPAARDGRHMARHLAINERVQAHAGAVDLVFVGDSITQAWEDAGKDVWAKFYGERRALNLGISGDRTEHVLWRLDHGNLDGITPKVAVVMIGTNNFGHHEHTPAQVLEGVRAVVAKIHEKSPTTVVLLLDIFPRGPAFNEMRGGITQVDQALQRLHDGKSVVFLRIGHHFIEDDGTIRKDVMPDYLHLTPAAYQRWAEAIEPTLAHLMGEETSAAEK